MDGKLDCERLKRSREILGLSKLEAARRMNLSQSGYVRYEAGERSPAYPTLIVMASVLNTSTSYLTGKTSDPSPDYLIISRIDSPEIFNFVEKTNKLDSNKRIRLMHYLDKLMTE